MRSAHFIEKPSCTTCRKTRAYMQRRGFQLQSRDLGEHPLSADELEELIGDRGNIQAFRALPLSASA